MTDTKIKSYQSLANKALADFLRNPTEINHAIANEAAKLYKAALTLSENLKNHDDKTAAYIESQIKGDDKTAAYIESLLEEDN